VGLLTACAVLTIKVLAAGPLGRWSASLFDEATAPPHSVDLTGHYTGLKFSGSVLVQNARRSCIYRFPSLTVALMPTNNVHFEPMAYVEYLRLVAVSRGRPGEQQQLIEEKSPLAIALEQVGATGEAREIVFRLTKPIAEAAEYVKFSLGGRSVHVYDDE